MKVKAFRFLLSGPVKYYLPKPIFTPSSPSAKTSIFVETRGKIRLNIHFNKTNMSNYNTGDVLTDLPSPYVPHKCGLLHLPRFIAKIRKHLSNTLPPSYQRNFTKGFDGFLCLHLGIEPQTIINLVQSHPTDDSLDQELMKIFPNDLKVNIWNRQLVQMGMSEMGRESLKSTKTKMGLSDRHDLLSFADMIEIDEGRIN